MTILVETRVESFLCVCVGMNQLSPPLDVAMTFGTVIFSRKFRTTTHPTSHHSMKVMVSRSFSLCFNHEISGSVIDNQPFKVILIHSFIYSWSVKYSKEPIWGGLDSNGEYTGQFKDFYQSKLDSSVAMFSVLYSRSKVSHNIQWHHAHSNLLRVGGWLHLALDLCSSTLDDTQAWPEASWLWNLWHHFWHNVMDICHDSIVECLRLYHGHALS